MVFDAEVVHYPLLGTFICKEKAPKKNRHSERMFGVKYGPPIAHHLLMLEIKPHDPHNGMEINPSEVN